MYLSLNGEIIPNHGYVTIDDIGSTDDTALLCHTNRPANNGNSEGNWIAPTTIRVHGTDVPGFRRNRAPMVVRLLRNTATGTPPEGIYCCLIKDDTLTVRTAHVGVYNSGRGMCIDDNVSCNKVVIIIITGNVSLSGAMRFTLDKYSDMIFTLSCISTGGPPTTVTWTRDSVTITERKTESEMLNATTARYKHSLTLTGRLEGLYECIVTNKISADNSVKLNVEGNIIPWNYRKYINFVYKHTSSLSPFSSI